MVQQSQAKLILIIQKNKNKIFTTTILLTLAFIWGNSILPATLSSKISDGFIDFLVTIFGGLQTKSEGVDFFIDIRKLAHFTEFTILGIQIACYAYKNFKQYIKKLLLIGIITALIDETLQMFSVGRTSAVKDIWIDILGYIFGMLLVITIKKIVSKYKSPKNTKQNR